MTNSCSLVWRSALGGLAALSLIVSSPAGQAASDPPTGPGGLVVVVFPDGGRGYLSKIFDDRWMADYGFLDTGTDELSVGAVFEKRKQPDFFF